MKYIIMDLEWNGATTSEGYFNEIIEIGAVAMDDSMNVTGEFQSFVNPKHTKKLRGRIKELTHITNEDLKNAGGFISVFHRLKEWIGTTEDNCMLSWGNADITVLYENLERYRMLDEIYVIKHYCDAQLLCQKAMDIPLTKQVGLSAFAELIEVLPGEDQLHRAIGDSRLTARCVAKLFTPELYKEFAKKADRIFYERMNFKSYCIQDLNDERIKQSSFMTECPDCHVYLKRMTRYTCRNKKHYARYRCGLCAAEYNISHVFKMTYDGLDHRCALIPVSTVVNDEEKEAEPLAQQTDENAPSEQTTDE